MPKSIPHTGNHTGNANTQTPNQSPRKLPLHMGGTHGNALGLLQLTKAEAKSLKKALKVYHASLPRGKYKYTIADLGDVIICRLKDQKGNPTLNLNLFCSDPIDIETLVVIGTAVHYWRLNGTNDLPKKIQSTISLHEKIHTLTKELIIGLLQNAMPHVMPDLPDSDELPDTLAKYSVIAMNILASSKGGFHA